MPAQPIKGGQLRVLTGDQIKQIDQATAQLLGQTGIKMEHPEALKMCAEAGCEVDFDTQIVKMPEEVWRRAIEQAPAQTPLYGKDPQYDVMLDDSDDVYSMGGAGALWVVDLDGNHRPSTMQDLRDLTRLQDSFKYYHIAHFLVLPQDIPQVGSEQLVFAEMMKNTQRPHHTLAGGSNGVKWLVEMAAVLAGSTKAVQERPTFAVNVCVHSPLHHTFDSLDETIECAKWNVPMLIEADAIAGGTSPFTIAGTLVEVNANVLGCIALAQFVQPAVPCIYSSATGIMDMREANYAGNAPEATLIHAAQTQLSHYYHLPFQGANPTDSKVPDAQCGYERASHFLTLALAGCNIIHVATGNLEAMRLASYEQCVVDHEILGATFRIVEGIQVDEDMLGVDVINQVGPGGHFLDTDHTLKYLRRTRWQPAITDRGQWETWERKGATTMRQRANAEARRILTEHHPVYVTEEQVAEIDRIAAAAQKDQADKHET